VYPTALTILRLTLPLSLTTSVRSPHTESVQVAPLSTYNWVVEASTVRRSLPMILRTGIESATVGGGVGAGVGAGVGDGVGQTNVLHRRSA